MYTIDVMQEINEKNNGAVNKKDTSATVEDENKDAIVTEEVQAETETTPEVDESQEENDSANVLPPGFNTEEDEDTAETAEQSEVVFVDSAFENMMRLALNKNSGAITQTDLDGIRQLIIAGNAFAWVNGDERYSLDYFGSGQLLH